MGGRPEFAVWLLVVGVWGGVKRWWDEVVAAAGGATRWVHSQEGEGRMVEASYCAHVTKDKMSASETA